MSGGVRSSLLAIAWAAVWFAAAAGPASADAFPHAALDSVLARVLRDGRVDYGALAKDHADLDRHLAAAAVARPDDWPRDEQIAFWVNAYNARVLDGVIRRPGLKSVLDVRKVLGIPTETLRQLSQPFVTTKAQGSGLGLFLIRRLVESAGGSFEIQSAMGRGTTCRVRLPRREDAPARARR